MNQNQITMTQGNERTFAFTVDDDWEGDTARLLVEDLFTKTVTVGADDGSGSSLATFTIETDDTDHCSGRFRHAHRYAVELEAAGEVVTVQRGLFVVLPAIEELE